MNSCEDLKETLNLDDHFAENMVPYFEVNPAFYPLLKPAVIHTIRQKQLEKEEGMAVLLKDLVGFNDSNPAIYELGRGVARREEVTELLLPHSDAIANDHLDEALKFAGDYLVRHALNNLLKAEVLSVVVRLSWINSCIEFVELFDTVSDQEQEYMISLKKTFTDVLQEIKTLSPSLGIDDLFLLSSTYFRMISPFTVPHAWEHGSFINFEELEKYCEEGEEMVQILTTIDPLTFSEKQKKQFDKLRTEASEARALLDDTLL